MKPPHCNICDHAHRKNKPHVLPQTKKRQRRKFHRDYWAKVRGPKLKGIRKSKPKAPVDGR